MSFILKGFSFLSKTLFKGFFVCLFLCLANRFFFPKLVQRKLSIGFTWLYPKFWKTGLVAIRGILLCINIGSSTTIKEGAIKHQIEVFISFLNGAGKYFLKVCKELQTVKNKYNLYI